VATFHPSDPAYESRVRASFARQGHMHTLSASLESVAPRLVEIALTPGSAVSQQHGFVPSRGKKASMTEFQVYDRR
jgi:hypothetical protein